MIVDEGVARKNYHLVQIEIESNLIVLVESVMKHENIAENNFKTA
jgi:hypothetical protein